MTTWKLLCEACDDVHGAEPCYCGCTEKPPFTREDVDLLRETAVAISRDKYWVEDDSDRLNNIADQIEKMLRPEER